MTSRIAIDPNVRVRGNETYAGFEDVEGVVGVDDDVEVWEPEIGLTGLGRITDIDADRRLIYLAVDWASLRLAPIRQAVRANVTVYSSHPQVASALRAINERHTPVFRFRQVRDDVPA